MKSKLKKSVIFRILHLPDKSIYAGILLVLFLLLLPVFIQAAGQAEWEGQVNNAFRQARQSSSGLKGQDRATANRYIDQAESAWNKLKSKPYWYLQQQFQQQNQMNKNFMQQQNNDLFMQQRFLQNQANYKNPVLQTINPFGDYLFHGVSIRPEDGRLHGPGTIADTPALSNLFINASQGNNNIGIKALDEMRHLGNIKSPSLSLPPKTATSQAATIKNTGLWDNPMGTIDPNDLKSFNPKHDPTDKTSEQAAIQQIKDANQYAHMSNNELDSLAKKYPDNPDVQKQISYMKNLSSNRDKLDGENTSVLYWNDRAKENLDKSKKEGSELFFTALNQTVPFSGNVAAALTTENKAETRKETAVAVSQSAAEEALDAMGQKELSKLTGGLGKLQDVYSAGKNVYKGAGYWMDYYEQNAYPAAAGGPSTTFNNWNKVNEQMIKESNKLSELLKNANKKQVNVQQKTEYQFVPVLR